MRSTSSGFTFSVTTLSAVALIVACSPNSGKKTSITPRAPGAFQQKVTACTDNLRASEKLKLGEKYKVVVCEIPEGQQKPVPATYPVSFSVQKEDSSKRTGGDDVRLAMTVGFETDETLKKEEREQWRLIFANVCGSATSAIFDRSQMSSIKLHLNLSFVFNEPDGGVFDDDADPTLRDPDQILHIKKMEQGKDSYWVFDQLPSRPGFYPLGKASDAIACKEKFPGADLGSKTKFKECLRIQRSLVNAPACAAFAKRVGNLLGIVDAEKEAATCGAVQPVVAKPLVEPTPTATPATMTAQGEKPKPTNPGESSSFAKPRMSDSDFMEKAQLNRKDLVTILSPVCPDQLKDMK